MTGDGLDIAGELCPDRLQSRDLLAQVPLGVLGDRLGPLLGLTEHPASSLLGVGHEHARLGLGFGVGLVDEFLSEKQRALERVVAHLEAAGGRLELRLLQHALELGDALRRLLETFPGLAYLFLQRLGIHRHALEVLVHVVDVVPTKRLTEFDCAQAVETRALAARLSTVHAGES